MSDIYYKKNSKQRKRYIKFLGFIILLVGLYITGYIAFPLISWQLYFAPAYAEKIQAPIPKTAIIDPANIKSLLTSAENTMTGVDYSNAQNWFPSFGLKKNSSPKVSSYLLSIKKLNIKNATVSTVDYDLTRHLVNYGGTAIPPENGNAIIFGHSTLPQLFNSQDYKTIFADAYKLELGDKIIAQVEGVSYTYKIENITVVDPSDTSIFAQSYDNSYITLVTCTPPGTVWKRLIIRAKLQKLSS